MEWSVFVSCPHHMKEVVLIVSAPDSEAAMKKAVGMTVPCPWIEAEEEPHEFMVKEEDITAVISYPWEPPAVRVGPRKKKGVIVSGVKPPTVPVVPPMPPPETLYVLPVKEAEMLTRQVYWWKYKPVVEKWEKAKEALKRAREVG